MDMVLDTGPMDTAVPLDTPATTSDTLAPSDTPVTMVLDTPDTDMEAITMASVMPKLSLKLKLMLRLIPTTPPMAMDTVMDMVLDTGPMDTAVPLDTPATTLDTPVPS